MKKVLFALTAVLGLSLALVATSCGGGGGGSDDDDATPVAESGSTGTGSGSSESGSGSTSSGSGSGSGSTGGSGSGSGSSGGGSSSTSIPEGFVLVPGDTFDGTTTEAITGSYVFISGRTITIPNLLVCDHEVTQAEYQSVMLTNPSYFTDSPASGETQANRPVERVSWYDAIMYCNKKSVADDRTPCYKVNGKTDTNQWGYTPHAGNSISGTISCDFNANGYRLPTEAEWEYLARGGNLTNNGQTTYSGNGDIGNLAWHEENSGSKTHEVKKKTKNILDLYDMGGNVWEWCWDMWSNSISASTPFDGALSGSYRVERGACWDSSAPNCNVYDRGYGSPAYRDYRDGFRVVCSRSE
ncbi:MAG: formylglycine-generating enzyme family protein [Treponema sp.]|nr:formylglycine-generating enzyme family protein [Treponema sp.]